MKKTIYVESHLMNHPRVQSILNRYKDKTITAIEWAVKHVRKVIISVVINTKPVTCGQNHIEKKGEHPQTRSHQTQ